MTHAKASGIIIRHLKTAVPVSTQHESFHAGGEKRPLSACSDLELNGSNEGALQTGENWAMSGPLSFRDGNQTVRISDCEAACR